MNEHTLTRSLLLLAAFALMADPSQAQEAQAEDAPHVIEYFDSDDVTERWVTVNDNVMGGRSTGGPAFADGILTFSGATNTNGGGFSSIRMQPDEHDLTGHDGLLLRVRGDGRTYKASIRTDVMRGRWLIPFRADFETVANEWIEVFIPMDAFTPSFFGREIRDDPPALDPAKVSSIGLMIYDGQDGPFTLEVDWIAAVQATPATIIESVDE